MPTPEQLANIKQLTTSPEELAYFFDQLTSPDWLPLLRGGGLIGSPPEPIKHGDGVMFPFWPVSRYMVRIAGDAPREVADALWAVRDSRNSRVWWDTVDALVKMPPDHATRFIPHIDRWVHHPWRLGLERSVAKLARNLIGAGARDQALVLARSLARLAQPDGWPEGEPWIVLDDYDYGEEIPQIGRALAAFGPGGPAAFVEELEAFLVVDRPPDENGRHADLSMVWRPAIEDHEQNWDHDREAKLAVAIRDGFEEILDRSPGDFEAIVTSLLGSAWPVVQRVGLHLLAERGYLGTELVERTLTNRELLADQHCRHEFYRLLTARFALLSDGAKRRFVSNVSLVANAALADAVEDGRAAEGEVLRKVVIRRWLGAVSDQLGEGEGAELEAARVGTGEDPNPDFPVHHTFWTGSTSPLSSEELRRRDPGEIIAYLATWKEPPGYGPHDTAEGLAQQLTEAVAEEPGRFAPTAPRYLDLDPAYFDGLIKGFQEAIRAEKPFEWDPVLAACEVAVEKADEAPAEGRDQTWEGARITVIRLLELGLQRRAVEIPFAARERVWSVIAGVVDDSNPTPAEEARYGPPNMEPETYSLNTTRGAAFHALFLYLLWHHRQAGKPDDWSIAEKDRGASAVLDGHLDPGRDPSVGVRAAYGWWLPYLLDRDPGWVRDRAARLVGLVETDLERATWEAFLIRSNGSVTAHQVFARAYASYAEQLAARETKPDVSGRAGDPVEFFIGHLVKPWLWRPEMREALPLRTLLAAGNGWLPAQVVAEAGRLISRTEADDVSPVLAAAYRDLWTFILGATSHLGADDVKRALAPFAWWFDSELSAEWTLPEIVRLLELGVMPNPDFAIFRRLPSYATNHPVETLRVLELLADAGDERWTLRVHEGEIRRVLDASIHSDDELTRARAEAVVHRLGQLGLGGLAGLLHSGGASG